jgi:2'-5' RNA ligase
MNDYVIQQKAIIQTIKANMQQAQSKMSIVPMKQDYENDDEISLTSVIFIPQNLTSIITEKIIAPLKATEPHHFYYPRDCLHITIKNVRKMHKPPRFSEDDIIKVNQLFSEIIPKFPSFTFNLQGIIQFPTSISLLGYCDEKLRNLIQALDKGLNQIGLPDDKNYLSDTVFLAI